jgi:hypothetical protein
MSQDVPEIGLVDPEPVLHRFGDVPQLEPRHRVPAFDLEPDHFLLDTECAVGRQTRLIREDSVERFATVGRVDDGVGRLSRYP